MLVGRSLELSVLNASLQQMLAGSGSVLFLTGEAGLGKTTLVHEWWKSIASDTAIYAEAACSYPIGNVDVGRLEALLPWAEIIAQLQLHERTATQKFDFRKLIHDAAPAWAWAIPLVGDIAHAVVETHRLARAQRESENNPNAQNQQQVFQQYSNLIATLAEITPLVIFLDDIHWADATSMNLLFYLSRQIQNQHILILASYRPDEAIAANDGDGHPIIKIKNEILRYGAGKETTLGYLGESAIRELMLSTFPEYLIDDRFERWLRRISDGNALFVAEFIKTLREDGLLSASGAFVGEYTAVKTPDSALAVVTERTRRLDKDTRELLSYATAEGEEFTSYILERLSAKPPLQLLRELKSAARLGIIVERGQSRMFANRLTALFGFSHALFHKVLYESLLDAEKEILHRQCYDVMKAEWDALAGVAERADDLAAKLMMHAEKCGEMEAAATIALEAARRAWESFAETEALEMLSGTIRCADNTAEPLPAPVRNDLLTHAYLLKSRIHDLRGRFQEAINAAHDAELHAEEINNPEKRVEAINQLSRILSNKGAYAESNAEAEKARALAERSGDATGEARALNNIGNVAWHLSDYAAALACYTRSLALAELRGNRFVTAAALNNIGNVHFNTGAYDEAFACHARSLAIRESIGDRVGIVTSLNNIGNVKLGKREFDAALGYFEQSIERAESLGDRQGVARSLNNIAAVYKSLMQFTRSLECYARCLEIRESTGDRDGTAIALVNMGSVHRAIKDWDKARELFNRALAIAQEVGGRYVIAITLCEMGMLADEESSFVTGAEKIRKHNEAIDRLTDGVSILRVINHIQTDEYALELERIRQRMDSEG